MKRAVVALALIAVASGCVHAGNPDTDTSMEPANNSQKAAAASGETHTVYYTSEGFQPQQITIQKGDTVVWVNNASAPMWVASNNHPTHTKYSGTSLYRHCSNGESNTFDQCSTGDRYSFTFTKTGEWGYHNHRAPLDTGTVVVE
ncbi:MAG: plastocyanin/azurin family copper-binding protein [Candidatus Nanohaloarchaea archaeon]